MKQADCIFCKIIAGEIPSNTIYEDDTFKVILDASPASKGHALILPKKHYADIYDLLEQIEDDMMHDFQEALKPLLDSGEKKLTPLKITTGIFQCLKENADICAVTLGAYGDKNFATQLLNIGRENCVESYAKYFAGATPKQIEYYYSFVSSGCIGLLEKWLADGMTCSAEEIAEIAENIMMSGIHFLSDKQ